jgi:hypothetical protein
MTSRQFRIGGIVLSAAYATLGILALAEAKYGTGTFWLVMSAAWLLLAFLGTNSSPPGNDGALAPRPRSAR